MPPIVSDAGPLQYLLLVGAIDSLSVLFDHVLVPEIVVTELSHPAAPPAVRAWLDAAPSWIERRPVSQPHASASTRGAGERAAVALARKVGARLLLIDDRAGDAIARQQGLETIGTLGVLIRAAQIGLLDLETAFERLRTTNFRCRPELLDALIARHAGQA